MLAAMRVHKYII